MKKILLVVFVIISVCGCKTGKIIVSPVDTLYITKTIKDTVYSAKYDSVYLKDSIYVWQKGDTLTVDRWHTQYKYKTDTSYIYKERVDTVYQVKNEIVEVEKPLTKWQSFKQDAGELLIGALICFICYFIYKLIRKFRH